MKPRRCPPLAALLAVLFLFGCRGALRLAEDDSAFVLAQQLLDAPNPAEPGPYAVRKLYYGSGTDRRRPEYRDSVTLKTASVDASKLVSFGREQAKERKDYWGFGPDSFPRNARVWYPEGAGPFPLVLIVHGNHDMKDFSDPGYAYLGELLASRGFIVASVDMNFLNGGVREENDARGWMLLKHLELWRGFDAEPGNPFYGKVDLENIALIGHSRGGEAVGHAAAFNRLSRYPDDATVEFDFGFSIKSLVAIAPVDGQYRPAERLVPVENVNYLVFHGSHDGDVTSFHGLRQYQRVRFTDGKPWFKAAVYVYRANHGQWNTVWGPNDVGRRSGRILDLRALLAPEEQRRFAKIYISAFLEATLKGDTRYLPIFRDHRVIGGWLPKTMYITRFQTSTFRAVADYEADIDVTAGSVAGVRLDGAGLAVWREGLLDLRSRNEERGSASQDNQAVWLGWNRGEADAQPAQPPSYTVTLPDSLAAAWALGPGDALSFLLAPTNEVPEPPEAPGDSAARKAAGAGDEREEAPEDDEPDEDTARIDLTIEVTDAAGTAARLPLSRYGAARKPLEIHILRRADREDDRFDNPYELVLQSYTIPLDDFAAANPALDLARLRTVRFVFDRTPAGTVVVDEIGFSALDPAFLLADERAGGVAGSN
ncbi:MAG TPA: hypothetical protein VF188_14235 [Longimicrobiales bacterium]